MGTLEGPTVRDKAYKWGHSYLLNLHWATIPSHRLCRWIHLAHIHSLCKRCKSSSNWLLLSVWPRTWGYFICLKDHFSRKSLFFRWGLAFTVRFFFFFFQRNFSKNPMSRKLKYMDWDIPCYIRVQMRVFVPSMCVWRLFKNKFFYKKNEEFPSWRSG